MFYYIEKRKQSDMFSKSYGIAKIVKMDSI
jgi:hypothetical protein